MRALIFVSKINVSREGEKVNFCKNILEFMKILKKTWIMSSKVKNIYEKNDQVWKKHKFLFTKLGMFKIREKGVLSPKTPFV